MAIYFIIIKICYLRFSKKINRVRKSVRNKTFVFHRLIYSEIQPWAHAQIPKRASAFINNLFILQFVWKAGYNASQTMACCNHACQLANYRNSKSFYLCKSSCCVKKADVYPFDWQFIKAEATAVTGINALTSIIATWLKLSVTAVRLEY